MRVSREQAAENRERVVDVASRLFREHGLDGIGLSDLMKAAGLTQGGFYKQFESKEDLAAQACKRAMERALGRWVGWTAKANDRLAAVLRWYLSPGSRDDVGEGCAVVALASDSWRHGDAVKGTFEEGINAHLEMLTSYLPASKDARREALSVLSTMVGALLLSRSVKDPVLSESILDAARASILSATAESRGTAGSTQ